LAEVIREKAKVQATLATNEKMLKKKKEENKLREEKVKEREGKVKQVEKEWAEKVDKGKRMAEIKKVEKYLHGREEDDEVTLATLVEDIYGAQLAQKQLNLLEEAQIRLEQSAQTKHLPEKRVALQDLREALRHKLSIQEANWNLKEEFVRRTAYSGKVDEEERENFTNLFELYLSRVAAREREAQGLAERKRQLLEAEGAIDPQENLESLREQVEQLRATLKTLS